MHKRAVLWIAMLLALACASTAQARKAVRTLRHGAAIPDTQTLSPEAEAMRNAQKIWPGRPLCDDGGYRIRPCDIGGPQS
jgi:hypothetical protein